MSVPLTEEEEFEFRLRLEREKEQAAPKKYDPEAIREMSYNMGRKEHPFQSAMADYYEGVTGLMRGGLDQVTDGLGSKIWPKIPGEQNEGMKLLGAAADPVGLAIGAGVGKAIPYAPVLGKGFVQGTKALAQNVAGGAVTGGTIGALSEDGTAAGGAMLGGGLSVALPFVAGSAGKIWDIGKSATGPMREAWRTQTAKDYWTNLLGANKGKVASALENPSQIIPGSPTTAADRIAGATMGGTDKYGSAVVKAQELLSGQARGGISDEAKTIAAQQEAARAAKIGEIAQTPEALVTAIAERRAVTSPMREVPLENANRLATKVSALERNAAEAEAVARQAQALQGTAVGMEAQQAARAGAGASPTGSASMPRLPSRYEAADRAGAVTSPEALTLADNAKKSATAANEAWASKSVAEAEADLNRWQLETLRSSGLKPINGDELATAVAGKLDDPTIGVSDVNRRVIGKVAKKIQEWTQRGGGQLDARALYEIRKTTINEEVERLLPNASASAQKKRAAGLLTDLKPVIDDAIESAGGAGWKAYLSKFSEMSDDINRMRIGQELQTALTSATGTERTTVLPTVVRKMEDKLGSTLTPQQMESVNKVTQELSRNVERDSLAAGVDVNDLMNVAENGKASLDLPNIMSRPASITNWVMGRLGNSADQIIAQDFGKLLINDPAGFSQKYLRDIPPSQAKIIIEMLKTEYKNSLPAQRGAVLSAAQGDN